MHLKTGELARQSGVSIRTLHHYDEIGLLTPSHRSAAGYRLYTRQDVMQLHRILALKQLGLGLAEIADTLASSGANLSQLITRQLQSLDRQIDQAQCLRTQLLRLQTSLALGEEPRMQDWLFTLELMSMYDKYFTPEEQDTLQHYRRTASTDLDVRWPELVASMRQLMNEGTPPSASAAQRHIQAWTALLEETVGNDPVLLHKLDTMTRNEPAVQQQSGIDLPLLDYVMQCMNARHVEIYARYLTPAEVDKVMQGRAATWPHWPPLIAAMRAQLTEGHPPDHPEVQRLAARWKSLFDVTHAGDDGQLRSKLGQAYAQEPELLRGSGLDMALLRYVGEAMALLHPASQ